MDQEQKKAPAKPRSKKKGDELPLEDKEAVTGSNIATESAPESNQVAAADAAVPEFKEEPASS